MVVLMRIKPFFIAFVCPLKEGPCLRELQHDFGTCNCVAEPYHVCCAYLISNIAPCRTPQTGTARALCILHFTPLNVNVLQPRVALDKAFVLGVESITSRSEEDVNQSGMELETRGLPPVPSLHQRLPQLARGGCTSNPTTKHCCG
jgi:hypothetical protein